MLYQKLFGSLWEGSLCGARNEQHVFLYLLGRADNRGIVDVIPEVIAFQTGIPAEEVREALANLEAPDPRSRSKEEEGRRIKRLDESREWGWYIVNHEKYNAIRNEEERRAYFRAYKRAYRARLKAAESESEDDGEDPAA